MDDPRNRHFGKANVLQRQYAHTAWTPSDPLADLEPHVRAAILLRRPTWRERIKLRPWIDPMRRRMAMFDIIAERRLMYDLAHQDLRQRQPTPEPIAPPAGATIEPTSPYYRYRLGLHNQTLAAMDAQRAAQDKLDLANDPETKAEHTRRSQLRQKLLGIEIERAKLNLKELQIMAGEDEATTKPALTEPERPRALIEPPKDISANDQPSKDDLPLAAGATPPRYRRRDRSRDKDR